MDQIFALMLYVQSGEEMQVLKTANWFGINDVRAVRDTLTTLGATELLPRVSLRPWIGPGAGGVTLAVEESPQDRAWAPFAGPVAQWIQELMASEHLRPLVGSSRQLSLPSFG